MGKYLVLYNSSIPASELMANTTPEQMQASMQEWIQWRDKTSEKAKVDFGLPLQAIGTVTPDGVQQSSSNVSGYSFIESESNEAVLELLKDHPHLKREGATVEVLELLPMPGLDVQP